MVPEKELSGERKLFGWLFQAVPPATAKTDKTKEDYCKSLHKFIIESTGMFWEVFLFKKEERKERK